MRRIRKNRQIQIMRVLLCSSLVFLYGCRAESGLGEAGKSSIPLQSIESGTESNSRQTDSVEHHSTELHVSDASDCGTQIAEEACIEPASCYEPIIEAARACVISGEPSEEYDFSSVIHQNWRYEILGYLIEDIDGDGTAELLIGENAAKPDDIWDGIIYDLYTISDGELVHVFDGWERNRYYLCENGMIANEGSNGAADSVNVYYTFDGAKISLVEAVIYAGYIDADNPWFYSATSERYTEQAEPISEERADELKGKYSYRRPKFIPFVQKDIK